MTMTCKLCLHHRPLRNSHILPEFLYTSLYDQLHRFHILTTRSEDKNRIEQKGVRERLLCAECEQRFSVHERYASFLFSGRIELRYEQRPGLVRVDGIDYRQFKLFQLSILWRASVSTLPFFKEVQLGKHAEKIRLQLLQNDPGPFDRYACVMWGLQLQPGKTADIMIPPIRQRASGGRIGYSFVFGGFRWDFEVSNQSISQPARSFVPQEDGRLIFIVKQVTDLPGLPEFMTELKAMNRTPI